MCLHVHCIDLKSRISICYLLIVMLHFVSKNVLEYSTWNVVYMYKYSAS